LSRAWRQRRTRFRERQQGIERILWWPGYANPVTWSLYIEAAFYVLLPLVVLVVRPQRMAAFALVGIAAMILADSSARDFALWRYFLFGIFAAEASPYLKGRALPLFVLGAALLAIDLGGPTYDSAARLVGRQHLDGQTLGIGLATALMLASLPHLPRIGRALNVLPLQLLGVISYSLYVVHIFFILANFPMLGRFVQFGSQENHQQMLALPQMPVWYLPFVIFPGMLAWALATHVLIERPGIAFGRYLVTRGRAPRPTRRSSP
jgi:peptidoglycan/LPS O-acetylase OafA/YrhL